MPWRRTASLKPKPEKQPWTPSTPIWPIVLLAGLLFFLSLDSPLLEPQEARYAEIPRQMLDQHSLDRDQIDAGQ